jgi:hypothetical protein
MKPRKRDRHRKEERLRRLSIVGREVAQLLRTDLVSAHLEWALLDHVDEAITRLRATGLVIGPEWNSTDEVRNVRASKSMLNRPSFPASHHSIGTLRRTALYYRGDDRWQPGQPHDDDRFDALHFWISTVEGVLEKHYVYVDTSAVSG